MALPAPTDELFEMTTDTGSRFLTTIVCLAWVSSPLAALKVEQVGAVFPSSSEPVPVSWSTGALAGGDVRAIAIQPDDADVVIAGTANGQIYRSTNGGDSWSTVADGVPFPGWVVSDLLFDRSEPSTVWASLRGILAADGFIAVSRDGGETWEERSEGLPGGQVYVLAQSGRYLFAGTRLGVWGRHDGGQSWQRLTSEYPEIQKVTSLMVDPEDHRRIFAGTWRRAYRSDDGGTTWRGVFEGMALDSEVFSLRAVPGQPGELWASTCGWVYQGSGSGESWQRLTNGLSERRTPSFLVLDRYSMLAGTVAGVFRSEDTGRNWHRVTPDDLVALAMESHPKRPDRVFVGTEGAGVWRSVDGGVSFQPANRGLYAARIASMTALDGEVLAAVRHAGPASGVYSSFDGGHTYLVGPIRMPSVTELANDGENVFAATSDGLYERSGESWSRVEEVGKTPVRQVVASAERVVARTDRGLYMRWSRGESFRRLDFDRGAVASVALDRHGVWVSSGDGGLYRVTEGDVVATATPIATGRIHAAAGRLLIAGAGELWVRRGLDAVWEDLGRRLTFHPTGSMEYPVLLVDGNGIGRLLGGDDREDRVLGLTVPPRDLSAALVVGDRLVVGTSGYGLLVADLPAVTASDTPPSTQLPSAR
jgi:photosystem II stability/assembly factor-like uncharacterized protein